MNTASSYPSAASSITPAGGASGRQKNVKVGSDSSGEFQVVEGDRASDSSEEGRAEREGRRRGADGRSKTSDVGGAGGGAADDIRQRKSNTVAAGDKKMKEGVQKKKTFLKGVKGLFKRNKGKEEDSLAAKNKHAGGKHRAGNEGAFEMNDPLMSFEKKLPRNFANKVLDYELKIDSGRFDINTIDKLMQLYSQAVEYYSGQNDEKYMYFTERIQNTLLRPEILAMIKQQNSSNKKDKDIIERQKRAQMEKEQNMSQTERMKLR